MDKEFLYELMAEFEKRDIHELSYESKQGTIRLQKAEVVINEPVVAAPAAVPPPVASAAEVPVVNNTAVDSGAELIRAPIVGNFYRQPAPDAPYFASEGERIAKGQTICILEAMKLMNELKAEFDCEVVKVLVDNGVMVEYNTPLFEVKRV